jgi:CBS domain-containing protein
VGGRQSPIALAPGTWLARFRAPVSQGERMNVQDIMSKNPRTIAASANVRDAARIMKDEGVGVVPVVEREGGRLVGLLTDRDIAIRCVAEGKDPNHCTVQELMSANPKTIRAEQSVDEVMGIMGREQVRRIPVVDERGSIVGIVAQADVVREANNDKKAERTVEQISQPGGRHNG